MEDANGYRMSGTIASLVIKIFVDNKQVVVGMAKTADKLRTQYARFSIRNFEGQRDGQALRVFRVARALVARPLFGWISDALKNKAKTRHNNVSGPVSSSVRNAAILQVLTS